MEIRLIFFKEIVGERLNIYTQSTYVLGRKNRQGDFSSLK